MDDIFIELSIKNQSIRPHARTFKFTPDQECITLSHDLVAEELAHAFPHDPGIRGWSSGDAWATQRRFIHPRPRPVVKVDGLRHDFRVPFPEFSAPLDIGEAQGDGLASFGFAWWLFLGSKGAVSSHL